MNIRTCLGIAIALAGLCPVVIADDVVAPGGPAPAEAPGGPAVPEIDSMLDMNIAIASSKKAPVFIYKHSTTCPINARAAARIDAYLKDAPENTPRMVFVKVIESRPVSLAIADMLDVKHESPQLILIDKGKAVWNTSHEDITAKSIAKAVDSLEASAKPDDDKAPAPGASKPE